MTLRALITGCEGFLGRHFTRELESRGWAVSGFDAGYWPFDASLFRMSGCEYDLVIHCAALVGGRVGIDGVNTNYLQNTIMDAQLFDWAVRGNVGRVLYMSSSAVYPIQCQTEATHHPLSELDYDHEYAGYADSTYGFGKAQGERMADCARQNGLAVSVVRPFSGYGEDQSFDYPFPSIVRRASFGDLSVWGPSGQKRDWVHVDDLVRGALAVVDSGTTDPVNICTGRGVEMGEVARLAWWNAQGRPVGQPGIRIPEVTYDESRPTGVFCRVGDPSRFLHYYTPQVSLEQGIERALRAQKE